MNIHQESIAEFIKSHWYVSSTWYSWPLVAIGGSLFTTYVILVTVSKVMDPLLRKYYNRTPTAEGRLFKWSSYIITGLFSVGAGYIWGIAHGLGLAGFVKLYAFLARKFHEGLE